MWIVKIVGVVAIGGLLAGPASAVDMCFEAGSGTLFVVKSFRRPAPAKCRSLAGYEASTAIPHPATGTACLNASASKLYVYWSTMMDSGGFTPTEFHARTEFPYPSLTGGETTYHYRSSSQDLFGNTFVSASRCDPAPLP
jgi:hypothetical protein